MKIILVGGGRMGQEIARRLADEGHDITVVDNNAECLEEISTGVDAMVLYGSGADYNVLTEAGVLSLIHISPAARISRASPPRKNMTQGLSFGRLA